jgi:hypothetical protein
MLPPTAPPTPQEFNFFIYVIPTPRLLEEQGIDGSRRGMRVRPRHRLAFFSESLSVLDLNNEFQMSQKLILDLTK